jgi:hypothetical protein
LRGHVCADGTERDAGSVGTSSRHGAYAGPNVGVDGGRRARWSDRRMSASLLYVCAEHRQEKAKAQSIHTPTLPSGNPFCTFHFPLSRLFSFFFESLLAEKASSFNHAAHSPLCCQRETQLPCERACCGGSRLEVAISHLAAHLHAVDHGSGGWRCAGGKGALDLVSRLLRELQCHALSFARPAANKQPPANDAPRRDSHDAQIESMGSLRTC